MVDLIEFATGNFLELDNPSSAPGIVVLNPPYGERLEEKEELGEFYKEIGSRLKRQYHGADAWILSGNFDAIKRVGLKPSQKIKAFNGALECRFQKYELYRGSKETE